MISVQERLLLLGCCVVVFYGCVFCYWYVWFAGLFYVLFGVEGVLFVVVG